MFFEYIPVFKGNDHIATKKHMEAFEDFIDNFKIMHEDVILRLFSKSLVGDASLWFRILKACSICRFVYLFSFIITMW
jgi:hypothetical protein